MTYDFNYAFCGFIAHLTFQMRKVFSEEIPVKPPDILRRGPWTAGHETTRRSGVSGWRYASLSAYNVILLLFLHVLSKMTFPTAYRLYTLRVHSIAVYKPIDIGVPKSFPIFIRHRNRSLMPCPRAPPDEKRSGERSRISWTDCPKRVMTNETARSVIIT